MFEVRGTERAKKGFTAPPEFNDRSITLRYKGLDNISRSTCISMHPEPDELTGENAFFHINLGPRQNFFISANIACSNGEALHNETLGFQMAAKKNRRRLDYINRQSCEIYTSNEQFNHWINRSGADLVTMISDTPFGPYPYAGIPWYNTPFGRDGIITALECLWISPQIAKGVLHYLAATQAQTIDGFRDAEPGKILHETRSGEMAELNEIPFKQYYGTIDATPLFIVLAGAYYTRTGDLNTIREIWPSIDGALNWIDKYGDIDGDGFIEYVRKEASGLFNQGWKDSFDSVSHSDGTLAELPIALCEVQGYVYDAWMKASIITAALGFDEKSQILKTRAEAFKNEFIEKFWSTEKSTFTLHWPKAKGLVIF
ncbi:MAG: hypothetical protein HC906_14210 [Bacteroidales bacterium]|nr:hypothetical protein [Bacteroidales bacterium]